MTHVIIASGQSLTDEDVDYVRCARETGKIRGVVAVSNVGLDKAPWADALVSHDSAWWMNNKRAFDFVGRKFARQPLRKVERFLPIITNGCNSGFMAMDVARVIFKAERVILLGFDMHGTHYFGPHPLSLRNTTEARFQQHISQFDKWTGPKVINCTPGSALTQFPHAALRDII